MKNFLIALQFLTIFPVKVKAEIQEKEIGASLLYFPLVGLAIGIVLSLCALLTSPLPVLLKSAVILIISVIITGGMHLDGFADTCDGFYGNRPKEKILQIMRDSHIGAMGAIGVTLLLLLKFSLIISLSGDTLWRSLIVVCCFARWAQTAGCLLPYARNEGKAEAFIKCSRKSDVVIGGIFTLIVFGALSGLKGIAIFFSSLVPSLIFIRYVRNRIGGMTGDTIGAVSEIAEASALFFVVIFGLLWN